MAGLTATGITIKDVDEVLSDIESEQLATISPNLNTEADGVLGQLNGIYASAIAECWELLEEVYQSAYPDTASSQSLSYVSALTGAIRQAATHAQVSIRIFGTVGTLIPAGTQGNTPGDPDSLWEVAADVTILEQGAFDYVDVMMTATTHGTYPKAFLTDNELVITTPVSGLDSMTILANSVSGLDEEQDGALRTRREQQLALPGASTVDAIRADMLQVTGVDSCTVFENTTMSTNSDGVPAKAIEVLVFSEAAPVYTDQAVADQIWASKPAGTQASGSVGPIAVTDTAGNSHDVYFSEPTTIRTYVEVTLTAATDGTYVTNGGVANAVAAWATAALTVGRNVYASDIVNVVADLTGVVSVDLSNVSVDNVTPTVGTDLVVGSRELSTIAFADITVTS